MEGGRKSIRGAVFEIATSNRFDLLSNDDEHDDPEQVVVRANSEEVKKPVAGVAKEWTKPAATNEAGSGGYREHSFDNDRIGSNNRDPADNVVHTGNAEWSSSKGRRRDRGGHGYGEREERPRGRKFDGQSGNAIRNVTEKRRSTGCGNWGTDTDPSFIQGTMEAAQEEDKPAVEGEAENKPQQETPVDAPIKEMTLEEYEKALEEKRKALEAVKTVERKVEVDKDFEKMHLLEKKRGEDNFSKQGQDKERGKREMAERKERSHKAVSINELFKPAEGEEYYDPLSSSGRGGQGERRESGHGSFGSDNQDWSVAAPKIEDQSQFPTLGGA